MSSAAHRASSTPPRPSPLTLPRRVLFVIFALSGISALLYQLIWQRALLTIYGSNIESVTMVVSAFMLGLGIGSVVGGIISKRPGAPLLVLFAAVEIGIGLYGAISLHLFRWVGDITAGVGMLQTGLLTLTLILVPTLLMGSTLPLLVAHYVNLSRNVGYSVSMLYFVNTLGAGLGALLAAGIFLGMLGLSGSVYLAVAFNFIAGLTILHYHRASQRDRAAPA